MESNKNNFLEYWKELTALLLSLLALLGAIIGFWEKMNVMLRIPAIAICGIIICIYIVYRKKTSEFDKKSLTHVFNIVIRRIAKYFMIFFVIMIVFWPVFANKYLDFQNPEIEKISPIDPIAGGKLQIYGKNFPDSSNIGIEFGGIKVKQYYEITKNYIEIRVPENVTTGPLHLSQGRPLCKDFELFYPIITVQQIKNGLNLLTEDIRIDKDFFHILFSGINTSKKKTTVYDIQIDIIALENLYGQNFLNERIDLGVILLSPEKKKTIELPKKLNVGLLSEKYVIKIEPMDSESFHLRIQSPNKQHDIKFIFIVSLHYFDENGDTSKVFSSRFFNISSNDQKGYTKSDDLPLNNESYIYLKKKYEKYFHDIKDLKYVFENSK